MSTTERKRWLREARKHDARARRAEKRAATRPEGHILRDMDERSALHHRRMARAARQMADPLR